MERPIEFPNLLTLPMERLRTGGIVMDANGNVYGTTFLGGITHGDLCGSFGCGVVWELTP